MTIVLYLKTDVASGLHRTGIEAFSFFNLLSCLFYEIRFLVLVT